MKQFSTSKILAHNEPSNFVGRTVELERLLKHANGESDSNGLVLLAAPSVGTSELLRQAYDRLFVKEQNIIPIYFEIKRSDRSAANTARRFVWQFLLQTVAFKLRDAAVIDLSTELSEIVELAPPSDRQWIERVIETLRSGDKATDAHSVVQNCLSAPLRAKANGVRCFVMIDGVHATNSLNGGWAFMSQLRDISPRTETPFVFAGHRRFLYAKTPFPKMPIEPLSFPDTGKVIERLAAKSGVPINDQTRDLLGVQIGSDLNQLSSVFESAAGRDLRSFESVQQTYTDEIFGGRIARSFNSLLARVFPNSNVRGNILGLFYQTLNADDGKLPVADWKKHSGLTDADFDAAIYALHCCEIVNVTSDAIEIDASNTIFCDYLRGRIRIEIDGVARALAVGEALSSHIKRAPQLMARFYRRNSALGLREILSTFDGREISSALIDYGKFKDEFKGSDDENKLKAVNEDNLKIRLPRIVYTAHTGDFYSKLNELCDIESSAVALGFAKEDGQEETAWIAAEVESKLEAGREIVEFWCDRLEMAALNCNFEQFKLWLIAPEGFTPNAMQTLAARNAFGSSRKQVELLAGILGADIQRPSETRANEYEFVVPMGDNTEMIAAHTVEEIARRHEFPAKAINQIKTALVEACINAAEHSLSPERKIYLKFAVDNDKITITVSNRGVRLADKITDGPIPDEGRRGWGLKLIKGLMDEVRIEQVDDGTRMTMIKLLPTVTE